MKPIAQHRKTLWTALFATLLLLLAPDTKAQQQPIFEPYWNSTGHTVINQANQRSIQIQFLQDQIIGLNNYIFQIQQTHKFTRFSRLGLIQYRNWVHSLQFQRSQLQWQLSNLMFNTRR